MLTTPSCATAMADIAWNFVFDDNIVSIVTFPLLSFLLLLKAAVPALTPPVVATHEQPALLALVIIAATTSGFPLLAALFNFVDAPAGFNGIVVE